MTTEERFFSYVKFDPEGCWEWAGCKNTGGYGLFHYKKKSRLAHRLIFEWLIEPLGDYDCCHHCDNPGCVNPLHLFSGDAQTNVDDMMRKNRHYQTQKTHCKRGHKFDEENTIIKNGKWRECRACKEMHARNQWLKTGRFK